VKQSICSMSAHERIFLTTDTSRKAPDHEEGTQDRDHGAGGGYTDELLFSKAYEVRGTVCRNASVNTGRLDHIHHDPNLAGARLKLHGGDLNEGSNLASTIGLT
jgi:hypothetical protein